MDGFDPTSPRLHRTRAGCAGLVEVALDDAGAADAFFLRVVVVAAGAELCAPFPISVYN